MISLFCNVFFFKIYTFILIHIMCTSANGRNYYMFIVEYVELLPQQYGLVLFICLIFTPLNQKSTTGDGWRKSSTCKYMQLQSDKTYIEMFIGA